MWFLRRCLWYCGVLRFSEGIAICPYPVVTRALIIRALGVHG
jgi:hypothetical protein